MSSEGRGVSCLIALSVHGPDCARTGAAISTSNAERNAVVFMIPPEDRQSLRSFTIKVMREQRSGATFPTSDELVARLFRRTIRDRCVRCPLSSRRQVFECQTERGARFEALTIRSEVRQL